MVVLRSVFVPALILFVVTVLGLGVLRSVLVPALILLASALILVVLAGVVEATMVSPLVSAMQSRLEPLEERLSAADPPVEAVSPRWRTLSVVLGGLSSAGRPAATPAPATRWTRATTSA